MGVHRWAGSDQFGSEFAGCCCCALIVVAGSGQNWVATVVRLELIGSPIFDGLQLLLRRVKVGQRHCWSLILHVFFLFFSLVEVLCCVVRCCMLCCSFMLYAVIWKG